LLSSFLDDASLFTGACSPASIAANDVSPLGAEALAVLAVEAALVIDMALVARGKVQPE